MEHGLFLFGVAVCVSLSVNSYLAALATSCGRITYNIAVDDENGAGYPPILHDKREVFFLDVNRPASCSGRLAGWNVCYSVPSNRSNRPRNVDQYEVLYALYRRADGGMHYDQVSETVWTTLTTSALDLNTSEDNKVSSMDTQAKVLYKGFHCVHETTALQVDVQEGDIIGACVRNPSINVGPKQRLKVVGVDNNSDDSLFGMLLGGTSECSTMRSQFPSQVPLNQLSLLNLMRLHVYINVGKS